MMNNYLDKEMTTGCAVSRRTVLKWGATAGALLATPSALLTKSAWAKEAVETAGVLSSGRPLEVSPGASVPNVSVNFGMTPFADATFFVIAMRRGWFRDVGIEIGPGEFGAKISSPTDILPKLASRTVDIATLFGPGHVQKLAAAPWVKQFAIIDKYIGTYLLGAPEGNFVSLKTLLDEGASLDSAMKRVMSQLRGKNVAVDNSGVRRSFLNTIFQLGDVTPDEFNMTVTDDARILALARGGNIQFASPNGAAQNVELLRNGWEPVISISALAEALPPGSVKVAQALAHETLDCREDYYWSNRETCLRFLSVMFRTIDAIQTDPDAALAEQAPYLTSVSGEQISVSHLKDVYKNVDPLVNFEDQKEIWENPDYVWSPSSVYGPQIAAAEEGGVLPKGQYTSDDLFINAYEELALLKEKYEALLPRADSLDGASVTLAARAREFYRNRNYLDAYRFMKTALEA